MQREKQHKGRGRDKGTSWEAEITVIKNRLEMEGSTVTLYFGYYNIWEMGLGALGEHRVEGAAGSA